MFISKNSWYHKVYRFWLLDKHRGFYDFVDEETRQEMSDEALRGSTGSILNLCLFVKVIFLYAPARYLVNISGIMYLSKPFIIMAESDFVKKLINDINNLSIKIFGLKNYRLYKWILINAMIYGVVLLELTSREFCDIMFILSCFVLSWGAVFIVICLVATIITGIEKLLNNKYVDTGGFYKEIVKPYAKAKKSKICPLVNFKEN